MAGLDFASSLVMGTLIKYRKLARAQGISLGLAALQSPVQQAFELARLEQFIPIFDTLDQALSASP